MNYTEQELKQQHIQYLQLLFDNGDWCAINDTIFRATQASSLEHAAKTMSIYMAINPIKQGTTRGQANVTRNSAWLLEADKKYIDFKTPMKDESGQDVEVPIEEQRQAIIDSGIPFATVVYSGSKSLHIIPRVNQHLSEESWLAIWHAFSHVLWQYGLRVDPQTCDRARWTRRPGVMRDNGNYQTLEMVGKRVDMDELESWFEKHGVDWKHYLEEHKTARYMDWNQDAIPSALEAHKAVKRYMFKGRQFGSESRAMDAYNYFKCMRGAGINQHDALQLAIQEWAGIPSRDYESTESILVKESTNVWKKASVPAFAVTNIQKHDIGKEATVTTPDLDIDAIVDEIADTPTPPTEDKPRKEVFFRQLNNYILMNNDIMRMDYRNPEHLNPAKINLTTFKKKLLFTDQDYIALDEFDGFVNEPNILNYQRRVFGSKWNTFAPVKHHITSGAWPTIEKLINHHFGDNGIDPDQREEFYDYCTVLIKDPKQKQQAILLYSPEQGTAKSALALLLELIVGEANFSKIKDDELESTFNSVWVNSLIINLDEPAFSDKKKMTRVIRDMITTRKQNLRKMQTDYEAVDFHAKVIMTSNFTDFMVFETADRRYWVRRSPVFDERDIDTQFEDKMRAEIGHFIHYLLHARRMKWPQKADKTFWLPQSVTQTNSFKEVCSDNENVLQKAIKDILVDEFYSAKGHFHIVFRSKDIVTSLNQVASNYAGLKMHQVQDNDITFIIRDVLKADNNGGKASRVKKDEWDMGVANGNPERLWRLQRSHVLDGNELFDIKM